jgi:hypothetical protein
MGYALAQQPIAQFDECIAAFHKTLRLGPDPRHCHHASAQARLNPTFDTIDKLP